MEKIEFIKLANERHNNKYDYSKVQFTKVSDKVTIICPEHGEFEQTVFNHLRCVNGCPECQKIYRKQINKNLKEINTGRHQLLEDFIIKANKIHNNKYDYSHITNFEGYTSKKLKIVCPIHGEFEQSYSSHIHKKRGCPKCSGKAKLTLEDFIIRANVKHNYKYNYDKVSITKAHEKVTIICPEHGEFQQTASNHLYGQGCPICANMQMRKERQWDKNQFIAEATSIHNNYYDYSKVDYINQNTKVIIVCPEHGEFEQLPSAHLRMQGCPKCKCSHGESQIVTYLDSNTIKYIKEYKIPAPLTLKETGFCRVDFYIPELNAIIEFNGIQHYRSHHYFGGNEQFIKQQERDQYVREYCKNNCLKLLEIKYDEDIDNCLNEFIRNITGTNK